MKKIFSSILILLILFINFVIPVFVFAATPTIKLELFSEKQNSQTGKWSWVLKINTTDIPNDALINIDLYKNGVKDGPTIKEKITNNIGSYYTDSTDTNSNPGSILDSSTKYKAIATYLNTTAFFEKTTPEGIRPDILTQGNPTTVIGRTDTPAVSVDLQQNKPVDDGSYTLLAPIGKFVKAPDNIGDYFNTIFQLAIGLCAVLAVVMIVISGIQYMGDESIFSKTEAKSKITAAVLGLLIALGSYALLNTINPALLGGGGVNISQVSVELEEEQVPWSIYQIGDNITACPGGFINVPTGANPVNINVCGTIATKLANLLAAAKANVPSLILSGAGSRNIATQQALRVLNNCPNVNTPSNQCKPNQVARPGVSNHEKGLAVDFNCNGKEISKLDTSNVCYIWLTKNANTYGFYNQFNLIKEAWHWSTTGT